MGQEWWAGAGLGRAGPFFSTVFPAIGRDPVQPITLHFQNFAARPGPAHDIGSEGHETRVDPPYPWADPWVLRAGSRAGLCAFPY